MIGPNGPCKQEEAALALGEPQGEGDAAGDSLVITDRQSRRLLTLLPEQAVPSSTAWAKSRWRWSPFALAFIGLSAAACRQSSSPELPGDASRSGDEIGTYVLRTVAGEPLPAVILDNDHITIEILADTLWLRPDGSGVEVSVERQRSIAEPDRPDTPRRVVRGFRYTLSDDGLEITFQCPDPPDALMLCVAPPHYHGALTGTGLRLAFALFFRVPLTFEHVGG